MIIQRRGDTLLLISQPDHAALAADIMAGWDRDGLPCHPRREEILAAAREHDNGWLEEDALLHVAPGGDPLDFIAVPPEVKRRIWPRAVERLSERSAYVAALVAQHALTIYARFREDPDWRAFFDAIARARDEQLARLPREDAEAADADYTFVRLGDQLSLIFCNGWTEPASSSGYRATLKGITLEVSPDPFRGRRIPLRISARALPARRYASRQDLQRACAGAPVLALEGEAVGT